MSYDPDAVIARRRLRRRLRIWQAVAVIAVLAAVLAGLQAGGKLFRGERIARIHVDGLIVRDENRTATLERIARDPAVRALVVHIDSPGGTVVGGEDLYRGLRDVSERKPVVAVMGTVATSAAYMAAVATDRIFAREGTVTGSIGVILQTADVTGMLESLGIEPVTIKSSPLKGIPSPVEPLSEEGREATRAVVADMYEFFTGLVIERRPLSAAEVVTLADGRIFTGRQARANGLIDAIGTEDAAIGWLQQERAVPAGLKIETVTYREPEGGLEWLLSSVGGKSLFSNALSLDGLVSLWQPDLR